MGKIKYIHIGDNCTICTGIDKVQYGMKMRLSRLIMNKKALATLNLVGCMVDDDDPEYTFKWYCSYFAQFRMDKAKEREEYNLTNPTVSILCSGKTLEKLKACF
jgi:hypothetical protein